MGDRIKVALVVRFSFFVFRCRWANLIDNLGALSISVPLATLILAFAIE